MLTCLSDVYKWASAEETLIPAKHKNHASGSDSAKKLKTAALVAINNY